MAERLDVALARRGLADSRTAARELILAGMAYVNGSRGAKPSLIVEEGDELEVRGALSRYVGRGGDKLEAALKQFALDPRGCTVLDIGASTGGFSDCLLQHGAREVIAVDVGHGQLHPRVARDQRVYSIEGMNARDLSMDKLEEALGRAPAIHGCVVDVSFISLTYVLPGIKSVLPPGGWCCALVKPQFECGPDALDKRGVVRFPRDRAEALARVMQAARTMGFTSNGQMDSPFPGKSGNHEYFAYLCIPLNDDA